MKYKIVLTRFPICINLTVMCLVAHHQISTQNVCQNFIFIEMFFAELQ